MIHYYLLIKATCKLLKLENIVQNKVNITILITLYYHALIMQYRLFNQKKIIQFNDHNFKGNISKQKEQSLQESNKQHEYCIYCHSQMK